MQGNIFNIQHFCTNDGPGIRTTVFLKGCPLRCIWCHNPESHSSKAELFYNPTHCINCKSCITVCRYGAHAFENNVHILQRENCINCGACAKICPTQALEYCGELLSAQEIIEKIARELPFFKHSGGGLTISGGEPLFQPDFTLELCKLAQKRGIHVCVETCGYGKTEKLLALQKYVNCFLFDYKISKEKSNYYLGVDATPILQNLAKLSQIGATILLRCPIIPDVNFDQKHFSEIVKLVKKTPSIKEIQLLTYHPLGIEKNLRLGKTSIYTNPNFLDPILLQDYAKYLQSETQIKVAIL